MSRKHYNLSSLPPTETAHIKEYVAGADPRDRTRAAEALFEQCRPMMKAICDDVLSARFKDLGPDVAHEAWADCLAELITRSEEFLRSREERPQFRAFVLGVTMRAVWRLQKRAQRERGRNAALEDHEVVIEDKVDALDFQLIFERVWDELLQSSSHEQQQALLAVGPVTFFADDWGALGPPSRDAVPTLTTLAFERRPHASRILDEILERDHQLDVRERRRVIKALLPPDPREPRG